MTTDSPQGDAALLIDWENLKYSLLNKERRVSISALRDAAEKHGRLVIARAYADWQEHGFDAPNLYASGIEPIYVPVRRGPEEGTRTKNSVDVKLTADCIELIHRFPSIGTYILVSGDQDFIHVINTLRPYGKRTILIGVLGTTSVRLAEQVDEMIYYDSDVDPLPEVVIVAEAAAGQGDKAGGDELLETIARQSLDAVGFSEPALADVRAVARMIEAVIGVTKDFRGDRRPLLQSQLGLELTKRTHSDFMRYGRGRLTPILSTMSAHKLIQVVQRGGVDWIFLPEEVVPEEEVSQPPPSPQSWDLRQGFVDEDFASLSEDEKRSLIQMMVELQGRHDFLSFNLLRNNLQASALGRRVDSTHLLNDLITNGLLVAGERKEWFDSSTGKSGTYSTFRLDKEHPQVSSRVL